MTRSSSPSFGISLSVVHTSSEVTCVSDAIPREVVAQVALIIAALLLVAPLLAAVLGRATVRNVRSFYMRFDTTGQELAMRRRWFATVLVATPWFGACLSYICLASRAALNAKDIFFVLTKMGVYVMFVGAATLSRPPGAMDGGLHDSLIMMLTWLPVASAHWGFDLFRPSLDLVIQLDREVTVSVPLMVQLVGTLTVIVFSIIRPVHAADRLAGGISSVFRVVVGAILVQPFVMFSGALLMDPSKRNAFAIYRTNYMQWIDLELLRIGLLLLVRAIPQEFYFRCVVQQLIHDRCDSMELANSFSNNHEPFNDLNELLLGEEPIAMLTIDDLLGHDREIGDIELPIPGSRSTFENAPSRFCFRRGRDWLILLFVSLLNAAIVSDIQEFAPSFVVSFGIALICGWTWRCQQHIFIALVIFMPLMTEVVASTVELPNFMGVEAHLMPTRFVLTICHFITVLLVFSTKGDNIIASLPATYTTENYKKRETEILAVLWLSVVCFGCEFIGLLTGFSIFRAKHNVFYVAAHFTGVVLMSLFSLDTWHMSTLWYIWATCSLLPAMLETLVVLGTTCTSSVQY